MVLLVELFLLQLAFPSALSFITLLSPPLLPRSSGGSIISAMTSSADDGKGTSPEVKRDDKVFTMGLLADIQYAPIDDGFSFSGNARYYRHALDVARHAAQDFQDSGVDLVVNLGDTVDGKCMTEAQDATALDQVVQALSVYTKGPMLHAYGNHCLYNADRKQLGDKLGIPMRSFSTDGSQDDDELVGAYSHVVDGTNVRLVVIDSYDISLLQRSPRMAEQARAILRKHNTANTEAGQENSPEGLVGTDRRFVAFNGAVGQVQLNWIRDELQASRDCQQRVIVLSHQPLHPDSTNPVCLIWNYDEILQLLDEYSDVVAASFAGHSHKYGYLHAANGIHFRVLEAVLESPHPHTTYAVVDVYADRIVLRGQGECQSATYFLSPSGPLVQSNAATAAETAI